MLVFFSTLLAAKLPILRTNLVHLLS